MFTEDGYGNMSPELSMVMNGVMTGAFTGSVIGGTVFSKSSFIKFIDENQGSTFQNTFEAKKQLQTQVTLGFARGAWIWGWRLGVFCGSFLLCTTTISVYRGKSSILEYLIAGSATGSLFKIKQGPRAMIAGGIVGGGLGAIAGSASLGIMYLTGTSMEDLRYWQYQWKEEQDANKLEQFRQLRSKQLDPLTLIHEEKLDPNKDLMKTDTN
ncbi:hypothetical protein Pcinc_020608 [Petrolisthes cinctipes]|uniref:Complex I assembly factor TIMMDC1, mitochondrial n=1 Tax=Petrolisthes cinctipes TaxID=88211 RepID=A0AAE1FIU3_PETCI|nr:hypothetical protein Pcinc_020608 [Petrolisthes cinctipes]